MKRWANLAILACGMVLSACSPSNSPTATEAAAGAASAPTSDTFTSKLPANAPVVKVATTGTVPPFSILDQYGNLTGYDVDVIRAVGEAEGFRIEFVKDPFSDLFNFVEKGKTDLAISGISYTPERAQKYALSNSYLFSPSAIAYKNPDLSIQRYADLKNLRVGALTQSVSKIKLENSNLADEIITEPTTFLLYEALIQDKVDAIVDDYAALAEIANNHPEQKITIVPYQDRNDPTAQAVIIMAKNNPALQAKINNGIQKIKADGTLDKINAKWKINVDSIATSATSTVDIAEPASTSVDQ